MSKAQASEEDNVFLTGLMTGEGKKDLQFSNEDVIPGVPWRAHKDTISWVSYIDDLDIIASCSFDKNVFLWDVSGPHKEQVGSLELGMKAVPPGVQPDSEQKEFMESWKITNKILLLKEAKYREELDEA